MNPTTTATNQTNLPFISQLSPADRSTLIFNALDHIGAYLGAENRGDMFRAFRPFVGEGAKSNPEPNPLLKYRRYHPVDTEALFTRAAEGKTPFDIVDSREVADLRRGLIDLTGHGISNGKLLFECLQTIDLIKQRMAFGHQGGRSLELMPEVQLKKFVVRFSGDSVTVKDAVDFFIAAKMKGVIVSKLVIADWTGIEAQAIDRLFAFMDGVEEISFERCKSEMIDGFLKRGAPFWRNLRSIDLSASYVKPDALEVLLSNCLNLRNLKLSSCFDIGFYRREEIQGLFSKMSLIEELDLSETDSEDLDWFIINGVAFWKNLRSVNLSKSSVSAGAINYLLSNCPIERLNVSHCSEVNAREINTLALSCCKTLSVLNLTGIELSAPIFKAISQLPRLNEITINGKSEESFAGIEMLGKCLELRRLSILAGRHLTDQAVEALSQCRNLSKIEIFSAVNVSSKSWCQLIDGKPWHSIDLSGCSQVDEEVLSFIIKNGNALESLNLVGFDKISSRAISALSDCNRLRELDLTDSRVDDGAIHALVSRLPLETLDLANCAHITNRSLEAIAHFLPNSLKKLILDDCLNTNLDRNGILSLTSLGRLRHLSLGGLSSRSHKMEMVSELNPHNSSFSNPTATTSDVVRLADRLNSSAISVIGVDDYCIQTLLEKLKLRELILFGCEEVFSPAPFIRYGQNLEVLDLTGTRLLGASIVKIVTHCPRIRRLSLCETDVANEDLIAICQKLPPNLIEIGLDKTLIEDDGIERLIDTGVRLREITLIGCKSLKRKSLIKLLDIPDLQRMIIDGKLAQKMGSITEKDKRIQIWELNNDSDDEKEPGIRDLNLDADEADDEESLTADELLSPVNYQDDVDEAEDDVDEAEMDEEDVSRQEEMETEPSGHELSVNETEANHSAGHTPTAGSPKSDE